MLLRVPRDDYAKIRSALTLLTSLPDGLTPSSSFTSSEKARQEDPGGERQILPKKQRRRRMVVATVVSVHGCARTAKIATIRHLRHVYRGLLLPEREESKSPGAVEKQNSPSESPAKNRSSREVIQDPSKRQYLLEKMQEALLTIQTME